MKTVSFEFDQIADRLSMPEALNELVHLAECMRRSHGGESLTRADSVMSMTMFGIRKAGIVTILNLVEEYLHQIPEGDSTS